jgi:amidase
MPRSGLVNDSSDPDFGTALAAASAIRARQISSLELTGHTFARIDAFQPKLNAYVYQLREEALTAAARADEALVHKEDVGLFHGVPFSVKESFGVRGPALYLGFPHLKDARSPADAVAVRRLREAGGVLLGATNVPLNLTDAQAFNEIYGTTNNPWDLSRTPGGSSGGSAASLAAGMAFLSIGSDIGGSIRCPAAYCGVYGHKPTLDIVNQSGHRASGIHIALDSLLARSRRPHGA